MKKLLFTLALIISLNSFCQVNRLPFGEASFEEKCNNGPCEYVFTAYFSDSDPNNDFWESEVNSIQDIDRYSIPDTNTKDIRFFVEALADESVYSPVPVTVSANDGDFQIKVHAEYWAGEEDYGYGVTFGYKDVDNYFRFEVAATDFYRIIHKYKGIDIGTDWTTYDKDIDANFLNIVSVDQKLFFSIDSELVHTIESDRGFLVGDQIHFNVSGTTSVAFDDFKVVKEFYNGSFSSENITTSIASNSWQGNGSGFFVSNTGYIITNYHVIEDANFIEVQYKYQGETVTHKAEVIRSDESNDLSIIKIVDNSFKRLPPLPYNLQTRSVDLGTEVFALGYPMALSGMGTDIKFTDGRISSKTGYDGDIRTYQSTTPIQGGNSGGPLFDHSGNLIAINSAKLVYDDVDNVSYSIKAIYVLSLMDILPESVATPSSRVLYSKKLTDQIKALTPYVVLIKVR
jgi:S1-C subfamily serine protease